MNKVVIGGSRNVMYVNPDDNRGRTMKRLQGLSQPRITAFWRNAVAKLQPTVVVDAGVNYGEMLLSTNYPATADIVAVEANVELRPYLSRSLGEHPNSLQVRTVYAFVSDKADQSVPFYVDKYHSGKSSGHPPTERAVKQTDVGTVTIDGLFPGRSFARDVLLFKLDVEGYEWHALRGMSRMLEQSREAVGCIEFNMPYMHDKGIEPADFVRYLQERFLICVLDAKGKLVRMDDPVYDNIQSWFQADKKCNDLILLSDKALYDKLQ